MAGLVPEAGAHEGSGQLPGSRAAICYTRSLAGTEPWRSMNLTLPVLHLNIAFHIQANYPQGAAQESPVFPAVFGPGR